MSKAYTSDGRRWSSMTHARRGHKCELCGRTVFGNGGQVSHGRGHVRRGEAVELERHYPTDPPMVSRLFLAPDNPRVSEWKAKGFQEVTAP